MKRWIAGGIGTIALVAGIGFATADASPSASRGTQPANLHPKVAPNDAALDSAIQSTFTPITPCRIVDTRVGHKIITHGSTRTFHVTGSTGFGAQGGTGLGCGIPTAAQSVTLSVTALGETRGGLVTIYPNGVGRPVARALSFSKGVSITSDDNAMLGTGGEIDVYVSGHGKTNLLLDVTGYAISPMWAEVSSIGGIVRGSRVTAVSHLGTGSYAVDFDRSVANCAFTATSYFYGTTMEVEPRSGDADAVFVAAADYNGTGVDTYYYLNVTC